MTQSPSQTLHRRVKELDQEVTRLREQLEAMGALQQTALDVTSHLQMPQLLETIVRRASGLMNATGGVVYLRPSPDSQMVEVVVSYNLDRDYRGTRLELGEGVGGQVTQSGEPLIICDQHQSAGNAPHPHTAAAQAVLAVPLTSRGRTHGALEIIDLTGDRCFAEDDLDFLMPFAHQAAVAVENALLYQEEQRQRETANTLCEAAEIIGRSLDLDQILTLLLDELEMLVPYDSSAILLLEEGKLHIVAKRSVFHPSPRFNLTSCPTVLDWRHAPE